MNTPISRFITIEEYKEENNLSRFAILERWEDPDTKKIRESIFCKTEPATKITVKETVNPDMPLIIGIFEDNSACVFNASTKLTVREF